MNISHFNSTTNPVGEQKLQIVIVILVISMQVVNFFIGIPLNVYVIFLLTRTDRLDQSVFFAVSQSASEILYALSAPCYIFCTEAFWSEMLLKFLSGIGIVARLMFQCLVCVERYLAVVHPITFLKLKPLKYRLTCVVVAWIYSLTFSITVIFVSISVVLNFNGIYYLIIVVMELFFCVSILKVLKKPTPGQREDECGMSNTKMKAFRIVLISLLTHLVQLFPLVVAYFLNSALSSVVLYRTVSVTVAINIAAGLVQPFFFLHSAGKIAFPCHLQQ